MNGKPKDDQLIINQDLSTTTCSSAITRDSTGNFALWKE